MSAARGRRVVVLDGDALRSAALRVQGVLVYAAILLALAAFWGLLIYAIHEALS